ncbi:MAG: hypothetical protein LBR19_07745 [Bifidobacteriaceae bacterium]|jgi:hypothetical protein|nr:hypothetical protein [Bifidobacteriaceae bacterium]
MTAPVAPHVAFAREVVEAAPPGLPYAFMRRAQVAALPAVPVDNSIEVPAYLVDMGLRRWRDPQTLFTASLARQDALQKRWKRLAEHQGEAHMMLARHWETDQLSSAEVTSNLETLVMFTGDDEAGTHLAELLVASTRPIDTPRLATATATMVSLSDPHKAEELLRRAVVVATDPVSKFLLGLRLVALFIKRLHDHASAQALIKDLTKVASAAVSNYVLSEADGEAARVLLLNLRALIETHEERYFEAVTTMERARAMMPADGFVLVPSDMADRYRAQVRINTAQALWLAGRESEAVSVANEHASITRTEHPYSLSEALLVAALFNELSHNHTLALSYLLEAERLLIREGAPHRLATCRRIAVAALDGCGKRRRAEKLARALVKDPLGERFLV